MNRPNDLEQLWKSLPVETGIRGEEMRNLVVTKITAFDRTIRMRNRIEIVAAVFVAVFFSVAAWMQQDTLQRLGSAVVAAGALWIIYYIRRHGAGSADPTPDQSLQSYRVALVLKYEHQIRLLRKVKFWYLLPMYVGLLIGSAGLLKQEAQRRALTWADAVPALVYTLFFGAVWWLNEVYAVRKLQRSRSEVISGMDEELRD